MKPLKEWRIKPMSKAELRQYYEINTKQLRAMLSEAGIDSGHRNNLKAKEIKMFVDTHGLPMY